MKFLNKITSIASACFLTLALTGCSDYLDVSDEVAENLTLDEVFDNPNYMRRWHGNLFNCISEYSVSVEIRTLPLPVFGYPCVEKQPSVVPVGVK